MKTKSVKNSTARSGIQAKKLPSGIKEFFPVKDSMLEKFFHDELKDIYWAEKHLIKILPKMSRAAYSEKLKKAFQDHLTETQKQVWRLEKVFNLIGEKPRAKKCEAMEGITKEGSGIIEETKSGTATRDVGLIMSAQKVEHYEIATYGSLIQLAKTLGLENCADILVETLTEEKLADEALSDIAENSINYQSSQEKQPAKK